MGSSQAASAAREFFDRSRVAKRLVVVLAFTLLQTIGAPVVNYGSAPATAATFSSNRTDFLQWSNWSGAPTTNHYPYVSSTATESTSDGDWLQLTTAGTSQTGFVWNRNPVSFSQDLLVTATYYLGESNNGGDGITFDMRPQGQWPNGGIYPASGTSYTRDPSSVVSVFFDTYPNDSELTADHLTVKSRKNSGTWSHYTDSGNGINIKDTSGNNVTDVEDGVERQFTIYWRASDYRLFVYAGNNINVSAAKIFEAQIPASGRDDTEFYWGWEGMTGAAVNNQAVKNVSYQVGPKISTTASATTVLDGASVTLTATSSALPSTPTAGWEYSTDGTRWTPTGEASTSYTFTATRSLTQQQYRYYVEPTALSGATFAKSSTPITLTVLPPPLGSETDTAINFTSSTQSLENSSAQVIPTMTGSTDSVTVEAWINPRSFGAGRTILRQGTNTANGLAVKLQANGNVASLMVYRQGFSDQSCLGNIQKNVWTHVGIVINNARGIKCYINADLTTDLSGYSSTTALGSGFYIGNSGDRATSFDGNIDEVRIWSGERTAANIASDLHNYADTSTSTLLAYYDFNEGINSTVYNRRFNATSLTDLSCVGSPSFTPIHTTTTIDAYTVVTFTRTIINASGGWRAPTITAKALALLVGGGGGGGGGFQGGGGGGGAFLETSTSISSNSLYPIHVGNGGRGFGLTAAQSNGDTSTAFGLNAIGGGAGASEMPGANNIFTVAGSNGGSGGGGSWPPQDTTGGSGLSSQGKSGGDGSGVGSGNAYNGSNYFVGGGGGGAGSAGSNGSNAKGGNGGSGKSSVILSKTTYTSTLAGGGGGSYRADMQSWLDVNSTNLNRASETQGKGNDGGGNSGYRWGAQFSIGSTEGAQPGTANTGGGGGAGSALNPSYSGWGATGGSGIIAIMYITASLPVFTSPSALDTTTALLSYTFKMGGSATSPLTRNFNWQYSSDSGTSWSSVQASTSDSYTISSVDLGTSGTTYRYRVVVTDSDTVGLLIVDTSTAFSLIVNAYPTITPPTANTTGQLVFLDAGNTSSYSGTGKTWSDLSGSARNADLETLSGGPTVDGGKNTCSAPTYVKTAGGAFSFTNNDTAPRKCAFIPPTRYSDVGETYTVQMWVNPSTIAQATNSALISTPWNTNDKINFTIAFDTAPTSGTDAKIFGGVFNGSSWFKTPSTFIPINSWTHLALVSSNRILTLYVNGVSAQFVELTSAPNGASKGLFIGRRWDGNDTFNGLISTVKISNVALATSQIQQEFYQSSGRFIKTAVGNKTVPTTYGILATETFTVNNGTGKKTFTFSPNNRAGIVWDTSTANTAVLKATTLLNAGTYYETITATDSVTASTTLPLVITVGQADTITVTVTALPASTTYTGNSVAGNLKYSISGLVNSDTGTVTTQISGTSDADYSTNCATGGTCKVGDLAPGGGYVFYVSDQVINKVDGISSGGIYLATAPKTWYSVGGVDRILAWGCQTAVSGTLSGVGNGAINTKKIVDAQSGCSDVPAVAAIVASNLSIPDGANTFADWFLPSDSEVALMYSNVGALAQLNGQLYWTSQQASNLNAKAFGFTAAAYTYNNNCDLGKFCDLAKNITNQISMRPIRAFSPLKLTQTQDPVKVGVYVSNYSLAISSPSTANNYKAIDYVQAYQTITQTKQKPLTVGQYDAYPDKSTYPLNVYGGSGTGSITRTGPLGSPYTNSANCQTVTGLFLTATGVGQCTVQVVKAWDRNYMTETNTATIYWIQWKNSYATQVLSGGHTIPLNGGTQIIVHTETVTVTTSAFTDTATPTSNAISSARINDTIRINVTGYGGLDKSQVSVTFRPMEDAVVNSVNANYVEVVVPSGATTGVIAIDSPRGVAYTPSLTISP